MAAVYAHESAISRRSWEEKTQREMDEWSKRFDEAFDTLVALMMQGPRTPEEWGFPVRDDYLMAALNLAGFEVPIIDTDEYFREMTRIERGFDASRLTIVHALNHYRKQLHADLAPRQLLKKPRDKDAVRAHFVVELSRFTKLPVSVIAGLTSSMLKVEVDERVIRRLAK